MGAEPWGGFTPYQPDIESALHALQEERFRWGEYNKPYADISFLDDMEFFDVTEEEREEMLAEYGLAPLREPIRQVGIGRLRQWLKDRNAATTLNTRAEVEALNCLYTDGTASPLDMHGIANEPTSGFVSPLPASELLRLYGTEHPTREMVEQNSDYYESVQRGHGIYIVVYEEDSPSEIYFAGYSYD